MKQRLEALHILRTLDRRDDGPWASHPAVLMWRGHEQALLDYALAMCCEWNVRQGAGPDGTHRELLGLVSRYGPSTSYRPPPWLGLDALHSNHRSRLKQKKAAYYPDAWASGEPEAPGNLWPTTRAHGDWVYMIDGKVVATMGIVPERRLRFGEARQCAYCNYWHNPEELTDGQCATCTDLADQVLMVAELRAAGDAESLEVAAELEASVHDMIRLTRLGLV